MICVADELGLLDRLGGASAWSARSHRKPGAGDGALGRAARVAGQAALVDLLGDEAAHVGVHPAGLDEEHPAVGRDRHLVAEDVLEHAAPAATGVRGLRHLRELQRVTEQDQVAGRPRRGQGIGQRELAGLVDDQHVDRSIPHGVAGEQPGGAGDEVELGLRAGAVATDVGDARQAAVVGRRLRRRTALSTPRSPFCAKTSTTSSRRLSMALWLMAVMPTRLTGRDQAVDDVGASVGLPGARRTLDGHAGVIEVPHPGGHLVEVVGEVAVGRAVAGRERRRIALGAGPCDAAFGAPAVAGSSTLAARSESASGLGSRRHPVVEDDRRRDRAQLLGPLVPQQVELPAVGVQPGDARVPGGAVGGAVEHAASRLRGRCRWPARASRSVIAGMSGLPVLAGAFDQTPAREAGDDIRVVEEDRRCPGSTSPAWAPRTPGTRAASSRAARRAGAGASPGRRRAAPRPGRRARAVSSSPSMTACPPVEVARTMVDEPVAQRQGGPHVVLVVGRDARRGRRDRRSAMKASYSTTAPAPASMSWPRS